MAVMVAYHMVWIYSVEAFATSDRGRVFAICASFGRCGAFLVPHFRFVPEPFLVCGVLSALAGVVAFNVPWESRKVV